jgi:glycosyltransferase involved in cell wall biosynthesis
MPSNLNRRILFVNYAFPPTGGAGVQRSLKLIKYMAREGWEPIVLTASNPSVPVRDPTLLRDLPESTPVYRCPTLELPYGLKQRLWQRTAHSTPTTPSDDGGGRGSAIRNWIASSARALMTPDPQVGWLPVARRALRKIVKKHSVGWIVVSGPPFSSMLLLHDAPRFPNTRVIADFRDEWAAFYIKAVDFHKRAGRTLQRVKEMERGIVHACDLVTTATEGITEHYKKRYPEIASRFVTITNGYDPEDLAGTPHMKQDRFTITYTGTACDLTTPRYLLEALAGMIRQRPDLEKKVVFRVVGRITEQEHAFIRDFPYPAVIDTPGYVSHEQSLRFLSEADLLVVIVDEIDGSDRIATSKIYEYIASRRPILALVPEVGTIADLVKQTRSGVVVSNRDVEGIRTRLSEAVEGKLQFEPDLRPLEAFTRKSTAREFSESLHHLATTSS